MFVCYVQVTGSWFTVSSLNGNAPPSLSWHNTHSAGDAESILTSYITFARYVTFARYIARYITFARYVTVARYFTVSKCDSVCTPADVIERSHFVL